MREFACDLPYGQKKLKVVLPPTASVDVLMPRQSIAREDEVRIVFEALENPIDSPPLSKLVATGQKVTVITSDNTRPCPSPLLLPLLFNELIEGGIAASDITVVVALGLHRPLSEVELRNLVGVEVFGTVNVINHDPQDTIHVGTTSFGTPVELFRPLVEADMRIGVGNIEFHYFAGFSGGEKSVLPGCASEKTISANHSLMINEKSKVGALEHNPVRQDIEEGVAMVGLDFILNAIVDGEHKVVAAVAGNAKAAHRHGCKIMAQRDGVPLQEKVDIVIVSAGGYPADLNLYQAQKALENAGGVVRDGGIIIWVAECPEGFGNSTFKEWICQRETPEHILQCIRERFVLGGHKAAAIAAVSMRAEIFLVSAFGVGLPKMCGVVGFENVETALEVAVGRVKTNEPTIIVMPNGGSTFPMPEGALEAIQESIF